MGEKEARFWAAVGVALLALVVCFGVVYWLSARAVVITVQHKERVVYGV